MGEKILLIEDDTLMQEVMDYVLKGSGYEVIQVPDTRQLFNTIKNDRPNLVIIDTHLSVADNVEVCQLIKMNASTSKLPVILCLDSEESAEDYVNVPGAPDGFLEKPFDLTSLIQMVQLRLAA